MAVIATQPIAVLVGSNPMQGALFYALVHNLWKRPAATGSCGAGIAVSPA